MKIRLNKINIYKIVRAHFKTLQNANTKKPEMDDWFVFFILPVIVAVSFFYFDRIISDNLLNIIITSLSIFVGLLINVVVLIFTIIQKNDDTKKVDLLKECITNITYAILISLFAIIIGFLLSAFSQPKLKQMLSIVIYFTAAHFSMTLLMIIKRMYSLFMNELEGDK